jgi:hypothetical protein
MPGGLDISKLSEEAKAQILAQGSNRPPIWTARSRAAGGEITPKASRSVKYLTETLLPDLEEKFATNGGVYTLDMLRETVKVVKAKGYEDGIKDAGFATLDRIIRPNVNVGDLAKAGDRGLFRGTDTSYAAIKQAALLDEKFFNIKSSAEEYVNSVGKKVEGTAKAFGKDLKSAETLAKLEGHMELPVESPLRLSTNMKSYYDDVAKAVEENSALTFTLKESLAKEQNALADEIKKLSFARKEAGTAAKYAERTKAIEQRQAVLLAKEQEIARLQEINKNYHLAVTNEKFARAAAENEIRTVGRGDIPLGRIQRGFVTGAGYGVLFGNYGLAFPSIMAATLLSPKVGINVARSMKRAMESGAGKMVGKGALTLSESKLLKRLLIKSTIHSEN